jgi:methylglutaconyl-CoA hydratase
VEKLVAQLAAAAPQALARAKKLLAKVAKAPISPKIAAETAGVLAEVRAGEEAREGIRAFLEKRKPAWQQR